MLIPIGTEKEGEKSNEHIAQDVLTIELHRQFVWSVLDYVVKHKSASGGCLGS